MGTPEFAVPSLKILMDNGYDIAAVVTATDKYGGRGRKQLLQSPVKKFALQHGLKVLQPKNLKAPSFLDELKDLNADLQIVVAFRMLPEAVWNMPPLGTYNLHGSLLPRYRGAAPINWAIINGEKTTGVTFFKITHDIDTGDILLQKKIDIGEDETAGELHDKMMHIGAEAVLQGVRMIEKGDINLQKQDDAKASRAPKIYPADCHIDWNKNTGEVYNFIRGLSPYPGAWSLLEGKKIKILRAAKEKTAHSYSPGQILTDNKRYCKVTTKDGLIDIKEIKAEGKKQMDIKSFLNGYKIKSPVFQ